MRPARAEATRGWLPAQQQGGCALHQGGQELRPCPRPLQEDPGAGAARGDQVRESERESERERERERKQRDKKGEDVKERSGSKAFWR